MTKIIHCPHCFKSFEISDEQYLRSMGKMRCGSCRETFQVDIRADGTVSSTHNEATPTPPAPGQPEIDSSLDLLDLAVSHYQHADEPAATPYNANILKNSALPPTSQSDPYEAAMNAESPEKIAEFLRNAVVDQNAKEQPYAGLFKAHSFPSYSDSIEDNIHSELTIGMDEDESLFTDRVADDLRTDISDSEYSQTELNLTTGERVEAGSHTILPASAAVEHTRDQGLITSVDELIDHKLSAQEQHSQPAATSEAGAFVVDEPVRSSPLSRWLWSPLLALVAIVLVVSLAYQLWLRQAAPVLENEKIKRLLSPLAEPTAAQLSTQFGVTLPNRRDLQKLQLLSARTEAHPTRSSTILLRVNLINHSHIAQPFPWLELSLTDKDGRLVARRALSPEDYLHNNRVQDKINANELQAITIELLSFPKHASGYELIMLNK